MPVAGQAGDLRLLRRQLVARLDHPLADRLAGRRQLTTGPLGEPLGTHRDEHLMRRAQLLARVQPPVLTAQPLPLKEAGAGELHPDARAAEPIDRLAVQPISHLAVAH